MSDVEIGNSMKDDLADPIRNDMGGGIVISIDAMGGDRGPAAVVAAMVRSAKKNPEIRFLLHGPKKKLEKLVAKRKILHGIVEVRDAPNVISMEERPSHAVRNAADTSMRNTIDAVKAKEALVAVSCGNTGALMALSMLRLRKAPNINRPAIAVYWPSFNPQGFNIVLDVGADIRAAPEDLLQYAVMGASFARNSQGLARPRIGLLNVGTEEHKGRAELHQAAELIEAASEAAEFDFVGYVEGNDIHSRKVDVIVTDGFSGNIAIKTAEGTAGLVSTLLREAFNHTIFSRIGALFAYTSLGRLKKRIDPRRVNGGVFLGLNGTIVKSHGGADATGISAAIKLAFMLAKAGFNDKLAARVATSAQGRKNDPSKQD